MLDDWVFRYRQQTDETGTDTVSGFATSSYGLTCTQK